MGGLETDDKSEPRVVQVVSGTQGRYTRTKSMRRPAAHTDSIDEVVDGERFNAVNTVFAIGWVKATDGPEKRRSIARKSSSNQRGANSVFICRGADAQRKFPRF